MRFYALKRSGSARILLLLGWSVFFLCLFSASASSSGAEDKIPVWNGSYYTIASADQFVTFQYWVNTEKKSADATYKLTADIRLDSDDWTPIGIDNLYPFKGVFSGDSHIVSGFKVVGSHKVAGLFGYSKGNISNLGVINFVVSVDNDGPIYAGGLVGSNNGGSITGGYAMGSLSVGSTSSPVCAGGLIGQNEKGKVTASYAMTDVSGITKSSITTVTGNVGGLVGRNSGSVTNCYASGRIVSVKQANVGGLVGENNDAIQNCAFDTQGAGWKNATDEKSTGTVAGVVAAPTSDDVWTKNKNVFSDEQWVVNAGYYPQLKVFANAETTETAREASALSAVPVLLTSWDDSGKDTASDVTGVFLIPKWTPPVSGKKIGLTWQVRPEGALKYTTSGDLWEISTAISGEVELTAGTPKAEKRFKLKITQSFGGKGADFPFDGLQPDPETDPNPDLEPNPEPNPNPDPLPPLPPAPVPPAVENDKLGDAEAAFNKEHKEKGIQIEFPKHGLDDLKSVGEQLGVKNIVLIENFDVRRVALTPKDGTELADEAELVNFGGGYGAAIEIPFDSMVGEGEVVMLPVLLTFVLSSGDLEEAGLDASRIAGNAKAFLEKAVVVKLPVEGSERAPLQLNALLKEILIINRDKSPENPGGVRILLPYLLADAHRMPKLVRDGETVRLVIFDGLKNGCLHDPIWLYRAAEESEEPEQEEPEQEEPEQEEPEQEEPEQEEPEQEEPEQEEPEQDDPEQDDPEQETPKVPLLVVLPSRLSLPKNESREVSAFISDEASEPRTAREITWRVEDEAVASIEKLNGEQGVWVVTGLEKGYTKMTATAVPFLNDATPLSASLNVTVTLEGREPEEAEVVELSRGGCDALWRTNAGAGLILALALGFTSGVSRLKKRQRN
jgi:hypothetical protein